MAAEPATEEMAWVGTRLPKGAKALLAGAAAAEDRSVAWLIRKILIEWIDWRGDEYDS